MQAILIDNEIPRLGKYIHVIKASRYRTVMGLWFIRWALASTLNSITALA